MVREDICISCGFSNGPRRPSDARRIRRYRRHNRPSDARRLRRYRRNSGRKRYNPYYHGTQRDLLDKIRREGLNNPFLASNKDQARYWGLAGQIIESMENIRVLKVDVPDEDKVIPDFNLMDIADVRETLKEWPIHDNDSPFAQTHPERGGFDVRDYLWVGESGARGGPSAPSDEEGESGWWNYFDKEKWLLDGGRAYGRRSVYDPLGDGQSSIYLGSIPWKNLEIVEPGLEPFLGSQLPITKPPLLKDLSDQDYVTQLRDHVSTETQRLLAERQREGKRISLDPDPH